MKCPSVPLILVGALLFAGLSSGAERKPRAVVDPAGKAIKVFDASGQLLATERPGPASPEQARPPEADAPDTCDPGSENPDIEVRESRGEGFTVDACGRLRPDPGAPPQFPARAAAVPTAGITIDRMTTRGSYYGSTYTPGGTMVLLGSAGTYHLSDGSSWSSGAGTVYTYSSHLDHVEVSGNTIRYFLLPPPQGLYQQTDFDSGDHSAQGRLDAAGPLVIEATAGSATAVMRGNALIVSNEATSYGEPRFNFYSSIVGSVVPFEQTYTIQGQTWAPDTFTRSFAYTNTGAVDFAHAVSVPRAVELKIGGPPRVPDEWSTPFSATVRYENGVLRPVTERAGWSVEPGTLASIQAGLLTTGRLETPQEALVLRATYTEGAASLSAERTILCLREDSASQPDAWPMYQANAQHTGYVPISLDPEQFSLRWQRNVGGTRALNPVTAADGRVFVTLLVYFNDVPSLFVLDARDGATLWSKSFGSVFSVNPPSYAYGTVYIQTGNHGSDTWLRAYDVETADPIFHAPHSAQWERYYPPTFYEGKVYVNGGYYGGMYGFDAFSGSRMWFLGLPQYDQWTPAVAGGLAYSYVGEYSPGLYAADRFTGALVSVIDDPNFEWGGWSMDQAPVVGSHEDVIAINDGRLISFDVVGRRIRWELARAFSGQASVAHDRIYAIDGGRLVVLDEVTGAERWSWQPPQGTLNGPMIVTDTHAIASTATHVYAVDLLTRSGAWSFPVTGHLAMGNDTLYVASSNGTLTAIAMPAFVPSPMVRLEVIGPAEVVENSSAAYTARVYYEDGRIRDRTLASEWLVEPGSYASFRPDGVLVTTELLQLAQSVTVRARYTERGQTVEGTSNVRLVIGVTVPEFIQRNVVRSLALKEQLRSELDAALVRENAALEALRALPAPEHRIRAILTRAIRREEEARADLKESIELLAIIVGQAPSMDAAQQNPVAGDREPR